MIRTRGLTKDFVVSRTETVHAVRGIDLDVAPGELVAVLGPNGAGKTTTMRMLTTLIRPTAGTATGQDGQTLLTFGLDTPPSLDDVEPGLLHVQMGLVGTIADSISYTNTDQRMVAAKK